MSSANGTLANRIFTGKVQWRSTRQWVEDGTEKVGLRPSEIGGVGMEWGGGGCRGGGADNQESRRRNTTQ